MRRDSPKQTLILAAFGLVPVVWAALLTAPSVAGGLPEILQNLTAALNNPFKIQWCGDSIKAVLFFIAAYGMAIGIYLSTRRNTRPREEHGSAKWGEAAVINRKYADKRFCENKILTQNVRIGFDTRKHRRNLNVLVCGGSGAGKTRFYCKPNAMNCNSSMVILDPKGEITRDTGHLLKAKGMEVKVLDLINMWRSHCYNPFVYLKEDNDAQRLVTNLFKSTTPKGAQTQDPFWDTAASMLLLALVFYLKYEAPPDEQNFPMVMEMLRAGEVREDDDSYQSPLDELFDRLEMRSPDHIAVKYYRDYRSGSAKTLKSIQITLAARLEKFNLESLAALTATDELDLGSIGEKKTALFIIIPDNDSSFNFLVSILYTQLFQQLFYSADHKHGGSLPVHVHFLMDEFANVSLPDDFDKILSVMRSRSVSVSIVLQNMAQLKALFEKQWESIVGNCDEFLYLGGNEQSTHKYVSELLGKETLDTNTYGKSTGRNGNYSTNYQISGRELLTPDEVRMLDNRYALLFIRGERPILDDKFDILRHPNVGGTTDGKAEAFRHGEVTESVATLVFDEDIDPVRLSEIQITDNEAYELLSEEDVENLFN
ncbi:VirD4-like conjugal transfer protein, CD1115 family [Caproiciproducens sp. CPB-2]|uniref:VirD4-like conjugal transfer protein, CD1115 family n=1 Tax=Caproiciproducens sp. CPB-2 TaxID=3030017 RepID=UPI0023DCCDB3|nr:type IV secretory system conjugative DNA transfer family protein [Caproiciproducens sp. CPB-2]MDF1494554.1 type IV secretory system conjugative DNA transfer family protein [Caproiciproducens sp. CPB-2]